MAAGALPAELAAHEGDKYSAWGQGDPMRPSGCQGFRLQNGCSNRHEDREDDGDETRARSPASPSIAYFTTTLVRVDIAAR